MSGNGHALWSVKQKMSQERNESVLDPASAAMQAPIILFVDDDRDVQAAARLMLHRQGFDLKSAYDAQEAMGMLAAYPVVLVLLDLNYTRGANTGAEGLSLLAEMRRYRDDLPVIVVTGHSGVSIAVEAMRAGATDFVMKPWNNERLLDCVRRALKPCDKKTAFPLEDVVIGTSPGFLALLDAIARLAPTRASLVIHGAPGAGKMLLARRLVRLASMVAGQGIACDVIEGARCVALPETQGLWIIRGFDALDPVLQTRLADRLERDDAPRVIALTSLDPRSLEARLDARLFLLLGVIRLVVPPLRERPEDIEALARHFLHYFAVRHAVSAPAMDEAALTALGTHDLPQEVRGLRVAMERVVLTGQWPRSPNVAGNSGREAVADSVPRAETATLRDNEKELIETALRRHGFNVTKAARDLGLTRPALYRRMARHGL